MEITNEQLSQLREKLGDKELKEMGIELPRVYDFGNIYAFKGSGNDTYKLTNAGDYFTWNCLDFTSIPFCEEKHETPTLAFDYVKGSWDIKEFDNVQDFAKWILKVNNK